MNTRNKAVFVDNQTAVQVDDDLFESIFENVRYGEKLHPDSHVNLLLSSDGLIKKYNRQYLGRDELTDVLSFTAEIPGIPLLGDIIIDVTVAEQQKENRTLDIELQILFLHGLLHLLGYDHLAAKQEKIMQAKETEYLKEKYINRGR